MSFSVEIYHVEQHDEYSTSYTHRCGAPDKTEVSKPKRNENKLFHQDSSKIQ
jgi:hypothetical protein